MSELSKAAAILGKKGGESGTGEAKARPSEVARRAAFFRWGTIEQRFWHRVQKGNQSDCWEWTGCRLPKGYGMFYPFEGAKFYAHRKAWEFTNGPIPEGMNVLHRCDNPPCCNPAHLFLGTQQDNIDDEMKKRRHWVFKEGGPRKITAAIAIEVRRLKSEGILRDIEIAKKFNISPRHVRAIHQRTTWKHI